MLIRVLSNFYFCLFMFVISIQSILTIRCYECTNCVDIESCTCTNIYETNRTDVHCILLRESLSKGMNIEIKHRLNSFTDYHINDTYYVSVEEGIIYNVQTGTWSSISNEIVYGCSTDLCNRAELLKKLPSNGLSLMLPSEWLNINIKRQTEGDWSLCRQCDQEKICTNSIVNLNISQCPQRDCQGSCFVTETFENAEQEQLCYSPLCSDDTSIGPIEKSPEINITAFYYIKHERFDVVEIDVTCNAGRCDTLRLFKDILTKLTKNLDNIQPLLNHMNTIYSTSIKFLIIILSIQILLK